MYSYIRIHVYMYTLHPIICEAENSRKMVRNASLTLISKIQASKVVISGEMVLRSNKPTFRRISTF